MDGWGAGMRKTDVGVSFLVVEHQAIPILTRLFQFLNS